MLTSSAAPEGSDCGRILITFTHRWKDCYTIVRRPPSNIELVRSMVLRLTTSPASFDIIMEDPCDTILYHITFQVYCISEPIILNREIPTSQGAQVVHRTGIEHLVVRSGFTNNTLLLCQLMEFNGLDGGNCVIDGSDMLELRLFRTSVLYDTLASQPINLMLANVYSSSKHLIQSR